MKSKKIDVFTRSTLMCFSLFLASGIFAMPLRMTPEEIAEYSPDWKGERLPDGRPKVSDGLLERMKLVSIEDAWTVLHNEGYQYQFDEGWKRVNDEVDLVGRAFTVMYMPKRPDVNAAINEKAAQEGLKGDQVTWPIEMLRPGDLYVADIYGRKEGGPVMGGSLATAIFNNSGNGVLFNGVSRDLGHLEKMEGFNAFVRGWHPSYYWASMIMGINVPINIGKVAVMPGDIILGKRQGILVIPAHLAEKVVKTSELIRLRDEFGFQRLKEGKYTSAQIDNRWSEEIEKDFSQWLEDNVDQLSVPKEGIQELLKERTW